VVSEDVVAWGGGDALVDGDLLGGRVVGYGHISDAGLQVLDAVGGVAGVPCYEEWGGAVGDAVLDEGVSESFDEAALASSAVADAQKGLGVDGVAETAIVEGGGVDGDGDGRGCESCCESCE